MSEPITRVEAYLQGILNKMDGGSSGGGTTVVANPEGEATAELEKIQIGNGIYSIPQPTPVDTGYNYSATEQELGTWIDGSKLYQRTFPYNFTETMVNWEVFDDSVLYDMLIDVEVLSVIDMGGDFNYSTGYRPKSNELPRFCVTQGKLYAYAEGTHEGYVSVKYTKSGETQQSESANFQDSMTVEEV